MNPRVWTIVLAFAFTTIQTADAQSRCARFFSLYNPHDWKIITQFDPHLLRQRVIKNLSPENAIRGTVIASPSGAHDDYRFHWVRDAAIVHIGLNATLHRASLADRQKILNEFLEYLATSIHFQSTPNRSNGNGEPKFHVDGRAFDGDWGRPQNDGPALRALSLIQVEKKLSEAGRNPYLAIKNDLDYIANHFRDLDFDPWEEVRGHHYYNLLVQRRALLAGAKTADEHGDPVAQEFYLEKAQEIVSLLSQLWDPIRNVWQPSIDADYSAVPAKGAPGASELDISVLLANLHTKDVEDPLMQIDDPGLQNTVLALAKGFNDLFAINYNSSHPGVVMGRYLEDIFDGLGFTGGNGWVLATAAVGEYCFMLGQKFISRGEIKVTPVNLEFYRWVTNGAPIQPGIINATDPHFNSIIEGLKQTGLAQIERIAEHSDTGQRLWEQINRESGFMQGAQDLTWSYISMLTAYEEFYRLISIQLWR